MYGQKRQNAPQQEQSVDQTQPGPEMQRRVGSGNGGTEGGNALAQERLLNRNGPGIAPVTGGPVQRSPSTAAPRAGQASLPTLSAPSVGGPGVGGPGVGGPGVGGPGTGEEEDGAYTHEDAGKGDKSGTGDGAPGGAPGGAGDGAPPGNEATMEPEVSAQEPEVEGNAQETAQAEDNNPMAEEIEEEAEEKGPEGEEMVEEEAPEAPEGEQIEQGSTEEAGGIGGMQGKIAAVLASPTGGGGGGSGSEGGGGGGVGGLSVQFGEVSLEANGIDGAKLPPEAVEMVMGILTEMRDQDTEMANEFFGQRTADAGSLGAMSGDVTARIGAASAGAVGQVQASLGAQQATLAAGVSQAQAQVQAASATAMGTVQSQLAATMAAIQSSLQATLATLETEKAGALGKVDAAEAAQRSAVEQMYATADQKYRAAGVKVGAEVLARGEAKARGYLSQKINRSDGFWEGHLTDNRCDARASASREVAKAYQKGLTDEGAKQADAAMKNKSKDLEAVGAAATATRTQLTQHHTTMAAQANQSAQGSTAAAQSAAQSLSASVQQSAAGASAGLSSHQAAQSAALSAAASAATTGIQSQAQSAISGLNGGLSSNLEQLNGVMQEVAARLSTPRIPSPEEFADGLGQAGEQFRANLDMARETIHTGIDGSIAGLQETAAGASAGLAATAAQGVTAAAQMAAQTQQQLAQLTQQAQQTFQQVRAGQDQGMAATIAGAKQGFTGIVSGLQNSYKAVQQQLGQGMETNVNALTNGLRGTFGQMDAKISEEAEKAAAKVKPRWKSVLKWVCIIIVAIAIAVVLGPLVIGAVAGVMGAGLGATIVGGAIVGAISTVATTVVGNAFDSNPLFEGVTLTSVALGALGGAVGAGLGQGAISVLSKGAGEAALSVVQKFAINVAVDVVVDTATNAFTGQLSWENFGQGLLMSVITNGVTSHPRIEAFTQNLQQTTTTRVADFKTSLTGGSQTTATPHVTPDTAPEVSPTNRTPDTSSPEVAPTHRTPDSTPEVSPTNRTPDTTPAVSPTHLTPDSGTPQAGGSTRDAPVQSGTTDSSTPVQDGPVQSGTTDSSTPVQDGPVQSGTTESSTTESGTVPTREGTVQDGPTRDGPAQDGPAQDGPVQDGPAQDGPAQDGPAQDGPAQDGPAQDGPAQDGPAQDGPGGPTADSTLTRRQPAPEVQAKGDSLIQKARERADASTDKKTRKANEAAENKLKQILDEQAPGVTDQIKMEFLSELDARASDPANAGKDMFSMIRDTVNAASIKDSSGRVIENKYLRRGEQISLADLQAAGPMNRLYRADKVFDMLSDPAKAALKESGVSEENFGQFLADNPTYDVKANLDPSASVEGYNDVAWWGLSAEGKAANISELVDALALTPGNYPQGGVRFEVSPEQAHAGGITKPTALDGMFPEWVPTGGGNAFGRTAIDPATGAGNKQEGVMGRVDASQSSRVENFGGTPRHVVDARAENVGGMLKNRGDIDGVGLVDRIRESSASNHQKAEVLEAMEKAAVEHPGRTGQELFNDLVKDPKFSGLTGLAR